MNMAFPFFYEVRYRLSVYDKENKVRHESFTKTYPDDDPLIARRKAFDDVNDYISLLRNAGRISTDSLGNDIISQPSSISKLFELNNKLVDLDERMSNYEFFKEEISIYLIISDEDVAKNVIEEVKNDEIQIEFIIHQVASYRIDKQEIVDNLEICELELYKHFNLKSGDLKRTVYHFGLDYADSGEDIESGAKREILDTPMNWNTIEYYKEHYNKKTENETFIEVESKIEYAVIIERGESSTVEFKRTLNYNFEEYTWEGKLEKNYVIAKTICSFLNSEGGTLFVGVADNGNIEGLDYDYSLIKSGGKNDKILLDFTSLTVKFLGKSKSPLINGFIEKINGRDVLIVEVQESPKPVFLTNTVNDKEVKEFFVRIGPSTQQITDIEMILEHIENKKWRKNSS